MIIRVVGLGPGDPSSLTLAADRELRSAGTVYFRTGRHPLASYLESAGVSVETLDHVYEEKNSLHEVFEEITNCLLDQAEKKGTVVYAVPGHPLVGEMTTTLLLQKAEQRGIEVEIVDGLSFIGPTLSLLGLDLLQDYQIVDGTDLVSRPYGAIDTDRGVIVAQVFSRQLCSDIKITLGDLYPDDHTVTLIHSAGTAQARLKTMPLFELDRQKDFDHMTNLYIPPVAQDGSWSGLQTIVARLRGPGGCPWDRKQTHRSLRAHLLDETYEVLEALDRDDTESLKVELGDLVLQIALHLQIALEDGEFRPAEVFGGIISKLKRRHPHVFDNLQVNDAEEVMVNWEEIKRQEKGANDLSHQLDGVPAGLPALAQALTYQERAVRVGYHFEDAGDLSSLIARWLEKPAEGEEVLGQLLFALVDSARRRGINPESALREANAQFSRLFAAEQRR